MSTIGAVARSVCNPSREAPARIATERERTRIYYIALYAEMERCRMAQVPMVIGAGIGYGVPNAPGVARLDVGTFRTSDADDSGKANG